MDVAYIQNITCSHLFDVSCIQTPVLWITEVNKKGHIEGCITNPHIFTSLTIASFAVVLQIWLFQGFNVWSWRNGACRDVYADREMSQCRWWRLKVLDGSLLLLGTQWESHSSHWRRGHLFVIWYVIVVLAWGGFRSFALQIINSFVVCACNKLKYIYI